MKHILFLAIILTSCNKSVIEENKVLKTDTMLQNRTIRRMDKENDSLSAKILLDSLKSEK